MLRLTITMVVYFFLHAFVVLSGHLESIPADAQPDSFGNYDLELLEEGSASCLSLLQVGARLAGGAHPEEHVRGGGPGGESAERPNEGELLDRVQTEIEQALTSLSGDSRTTPKLQTVESGVVASTGKKLEHPKSVANVFDESATSVQEHTADKADDILMRVAAEDLSQLKNVLGSEAEHGTAQVRQGTTLAEDPSQTKKVLSSGADPGTASMYQQSVPVITGKPSEAPAAAKKNATSNASAQQGQDTKKKVDFSSVGLGSWMFVLVVTAVCMGYILFTCVASGGVEAIEEGVEEAWDAMGDFTSELSWCCSTIAGACFNHSSATVVVANIIFLWVVCVTLWLMWKYQIIQPVLDQMVCYLMIMIILVYVMFLVFVSILNELNSFKEKFGIEKIKQEMEEAEEALKKLDEELEQAGVPKNCC